MTHPTLTLSPDPRGNYVTWKEGKRQIRTKLRKAGYSVPGHFRLRRVDKNTFQCLAVYANRTYVVNAERKPNAPFIFTHLG